jgi:hypothetical protein
MPGVPDRSRHLLKQLLSEELIPVAAMPHIVQSYVKVVRDAYRQNGRANVQRAEAIATAALSLLDSVNEKIPKKNLRIIQAAIRYFVIQDDGHSHDLATPDGLDDDARVMNAVLRFFGRDDLFIPGLGDEPPTRNDVQTAHTRQVSRPTPTDPPPGKAARPKAKSGLMGRLRRGR